MNCPDCGRELWAKLPATSCDKSGDRPTVKNIECLSITVARLREQLAEARASLRPFAEIDLTKTEQPTNFAWCVLRARRALEMK